MSVEKTNPEVEQNGYRSQREKNTWRGAASLPSDRVNAT